MPGQRPGTPLGQWLCRRHVPHLQPGECGQRRLAAGRGWRLLHRDLRRGCTRLHRRGAPSPCGQPQVCPGLICPPRSARCGARVGRVGGLSWRRAAPARRRWRGRCKGLAGKPGSPTAPTRRCPRARTAPQPSRSLPSWSAATRTHRSLTVCRRWESAWRHCYVRLRASLSPASIRCPHKPSHRCVHHGATLQRICCGLGWLSTSKDRAAPPMPLRLPAQQQAPPPSVGSATARPSAAALPALRGATSPRTASAVAPVPRASRAPPVDTPVWPARPRPIAPATPALVGTTSPRRVLSAAPVRSAAPARPGATPRRRAQPQQTVSAPTAPPSTIDLPLRPPMHPVPPVLPVLRVGTRHQAAG